MNPTLDAKQIHQTLYEATTHHQAGRINEAESLYRKVLDTSGNNPEANHNLGVLAMQTGKGLESAMPYFQRAWEADPTHHQHWLSYLRALRQSNDLDQAKRVYDDGRKRGLQGPDPTSSATTSASVEPRETPAPATAASNRAGPVPKAFQSQLRRTRKLLQERSFDRAARRAEKLCKERPEQPGGWKAFGLALQGLGQFEQAVKALGHADKLLPGDKDTRTALGQSLIGLGRFKEAEAILRPLHEQQPEQLQIALPFAQSLLRLYQPGEAQRVCEVALARHKRSAELKNCLGHALLAQNLDNDAIAAFEDALSLEPQSLDSYYALYRLNSEHNRQAEQLALCERMIRNAPDYKGAHGDLGVALLRFGKVEEAAMALDQAIAMQPDALVPRSNWLFCHNYLQQLPPETRYEQAVAYGKLASATATPFTAWSCGTSPAKLRVGLVSGDFRNHPVGYFLQNLLDNLDRSQIECFAYTTRTSQDALAESLKSNFDEWRVIAGLSDTERANQIHADGIHILIDLAGHTANNALATFAWRPAPVQIGWLGYFATTGLAEMDYLLVDAIGAGNGQEAYFSEQLWTLPESRLCFTPPETAPAATPPPCVENGFITFGCFQNLRKVSDEVLSLWSQVLDQIPTARLRIQNPGLESEESREQLAARASRCGIPTERLELLPPTDRQTYLEAHQHVDILLDTFPFPGGTTTCEALWMGVPTISMTGDSLLQSQGASLLHAAWLGDWVAKSPQDYVELAQQHTADYQALATLRSSMREKLANTALFNGERFSSQFTDALWDIWKEKAPRLQA